LGLSVLRASDFGTFRSNKDGGFVLCNRRDRDSILLEGMDPELGKSMKELADFVLSYSQMKMSPTKNYTEY